MITERTEIFALNLSSPEIELLNGKGIEVFEGSLGYLTELKYLRSSTVHCLPNLEFPENFHEYQVGIIDLCNEYTVPYVAEEHTRKNSKSEDQVYLTCSHPQGIFDPRPFSLYVTREKFTENLNKGFLLIIFCSDNLEVKYKLSTGSNFAAKPFDFLFCAPEMDHKSGRKTKISTDNEGVLFNFLKKYNDQFNYSVLFNIPERYSNGSYVPVPGYTPLVLSSDERIAGLSWHNEISGVFFLPNLDNKATFLEEFLQEVAPQLFPNLFPHISRDKWVLEEPYHVPNQTRLLFEQRQLEQEFMNALAHKERQLTENALYFVFLTKMITTTGDELVGSVVEFLKWIGFENAVDADKGRGKQLKEEDVNFEFSASLTVIEVKGITKPAPADNDCNQINKIKLRRIQQRKGVKVYAHTIINHDRNKPALERVNPPFSADQIKDAMYEKRGLMTTWQLFNVAIAVENKILTKGQVRSFFYKTGLLDFIPADWVRLGSPVKIFPKINVIILQLDGKVTLKVNDRLVFKIGDEFKMVQIKSVTSSQSQVAATGNGEFGIQLDTLVPKSAILYCFSKSRT